jgi:integrase
MQSECKRTSSPVIGSDPRPPLPRAPLALSPRGTSSMRRTYATMARRGGVPLEVLSRLLTHGSVQTTADTYLHSTVEDLRGELERAGWLPAIEAAR